MISSTQRFRNNLELRCNDGDAALLVIEPNVTVSPTVPTTVPWGTVPTTVPLTVLFQWPDTVYYHSYTTPYMGWKIHIIDSFR